MALELLELLTGTSWAIRMAGGQATQRGGGGGSQGPANPKKAQAKGKSRSPRGKGGGTDRGEQGGGGRGGEGGRGSSGTPGSKGQEEGSKSRQVSRQPESPCSNRGTPRLRKASQNPVGFGRTEETPVLEVDSGSSPDHPRGRLPPDEPVRRTEAYERDLEREVEHPPRKEEEKKMGDETFREYMALLRRNVREAEQREMKRSAYSDTPGRSQEGALGGEGGELREGGRVEERRQRQERPFFPTWEGQPFSPSEPTPQRQSTSSALGAQRDIEANQGAKRGRGKGGGGARTLGYDDVATGTDRLGRGKGGGEGEGERGKGKKVLIAKTFPRPRPLQIAMTGLSSGSPTKRGRELGERSPDYIDADPTEAATQGQGPDEGHQGGGVEEEDGGQGWGDSRVSPPMEELLRTAAIPQPQQLTPDALPRADVITAGRKQAGSPAKLRRVGGGEEEALKEDDPMQPNEEEGEVEETARAAVSPTQPFTPKGQRGGSPGLGEDEVEEVVFTGGVDEEGGEGGGRVAEGGGVEYVEEEDGQGGNETPHAPTEAWSDAGDVGAPMDEEEGEGEERGGEGGIDIPPRPLPPGGGRGGEGGYDIPPLPRPPGVGGGGEGGIDTPQGLRPPGGGGGGEGGIDVEPRLLPPTGAGGRRLTTPEWTTTTRSDDHHPPAPGPQQGTSGAAGQGWHLEDEEERRGGEVDVQATSGGTAGSEKGVGGC